jgi:hypothetical protein
MVKEKYGDGSKIFIYGEGGGGIYEKKTIRPRVFLSYDKI